MVNGNAFMFSSTQPFGTFNLFTFKVIINMHDPITIFLTVAQSCLTVCDTMDGSPLGSPVHGIVKARILEWLPIAFSRGSS